MAVTFQTTIPILRIFDLTKAKEFYVGFLGFSVDWEHRFDDAAPTYLQVTRNNLIIHLSEHHGDSCPGSTVFVWMTDLELFHQELSSKNYVYAHPTIDTTFYNSKCMTIADPFGNRIRFNESLNSGG